MLKTARFHFQMQDFTISDFLTYGL